MSERAPGFGWRRSPKALGVMELGDLTDPPDGVAGEFGYFSV